MNEELKPCSCGREPQTIMFCDDLLGWIYKVRCSSCGMMVESLADMEDAIRKWNHRPSEDAKDKEIERLKAEVTRYRRALHNLKEDCQKRLHWKNSSWERVFLHEVITHIDAELDFAPDTGKMEEK